MQFIILGIVGLLSGICASLGIGGGFILLIYLTAIISTNQLEAQLINLIFFIPIGTIALFLHIKHKLVDKSVALPASISGSLGAVFGVLIATLLNPTLVSKLFAIFILLMGLNQLFAKEKITDQHKI